MELILIAVVAMIMAVISLISILSQTRTIANNRTKLKWHIHSILGRERLHLAVNRSKNTSRSGGKKPGK